MVPTLARVRVVAVPGVVPCLRQPGTVGMKPLKASTPATGGRSSLQAIVWLITAPIEKPPRTVRSGPIPPSSQSPS